MFRNSDGLRRIYLDGVNISTYGPNNTSTPAGLPAAVKVGQAVQGYMDDYRVYATALSDADILAIYNKRANLDNLGNVQVNEIQEDKNLTPNPSFDIDSPGTLTPTG